MDARPGDRSALRVQDGHSRGDPRVYRTREEEKAWRKKDPIKRFRSYLLKAGLMSKKEDVAIRQEARRSVRDAVTFARRSPDPDPGTLE